MPPMFCTFVRSLGIRSARRNGEGAPPRWLPSEGDIGEDKLSWELTPGPWYGACLTHSQWFGEH